jgi:hypothetical protein
MKSPAWGRGANPSAPHGWGGGRGAESIDNHPNELAGGLLYIGVRLNCRLSGPSLPQAARQIDQPNAAG